VRSRDLDGAVVVVTGASSGLARATALAFADHGCALVLAARAERPLREVAAEIEGRGGRALVVPTDVGSADAVEHLGRRAVEAFGGIDVWVDAAGVLLAGPFGREPVEEVERLVATNVMGTVYGARVALEQFRRQGQGTFIAVSSMLGIVVNPMVPLYTMTKFAVRGLALSLHQVVRREPGIHVCTVLPGPVDTEIFQRAANHTGRRLRAIPPACSPERAAAAIVACARRPRRQVVVGVTSRLLLALPHRVAPAFTERVVAEVTGRLIVQREAAPDTAGALFDAPESATTSPGWRLLAPRRALGDAWGRALARRGRAHHGARRAGLRQAAARSR
jgi:short-subunit dehydrogenase